MATFSMRRECIDYGGIPCPESWYGCLHPREKSVLDFVWQSLDSMTNPILRAPFDALWVLNGGSVGSDRYNQMLNVFGFMTSEIDIDGNPVGVITVDTVNAGNGIISYRNEKGFVPLSPCDIGRYFLDRHK